MTKPVIELKNIKVAAFASEETHCYDATLYVDGEKWGFVSNQGHGGPDMFHGLNGRGHADIAALDARIAATFPKADVSYLYGDGQKHEMDESLETVCGELVNAHLMAKELRRTLSRKALFTKPGEGGFYEIPLKGRSPEAMAMAIAAKWSGAKVLNAMPFDEALALFRGEGRA